MIEISAAVKEITLLQERTDFLQLSLVEKRRLADDVNTRLITFVKEGNQDVALLSGDLVYKIKRAAELTAFFYWQAEDFEKACISLCNALTITLMTEIFMAESIFPLHEPETVWKLAWLLQSSEHTNMARENMKEVWGFSEEELNEFVLGIFRWAEHHRRDIRELGQATSLQAVEQDSQVLPQLEHAQSEIVQHEIQDVQPEQVNQATSQLETSTLTSDGAIPTEVSTQIQDSLPPEITQPTSYFARFNKPVIKYSLSIATIVGIAAVVYKTGFASWLGNALAHVWA